MNYVLLCLSVVAFVVAVTGPFALRRWTMCSLGAALTFAWFFIGVAWLFNVAARLV